MENENEKNAQLCRIAQKVLFYDKDDGKFLFLKAHYDDNDPIDKESRKKFGPWDLPGGHINNGEDDLLKALVREVQEETGMTIDTSAAVCRLELMTSKERTHRGLSVIYLLEYPGEPIILSDEHEEFIWLSAEDAAKHKELKPWLKDSVEKAVQQLELKDSLNSWHRCLADFDNYKKRSDQQQKDFAQYAGETVITDMLPVLDNFHASTDHIPEDQKDDPWVTGIMYIQQQMEKVFDDQGVTEISVKVGDEFDAATMEAMEVNDSAGEQEASGEDQNENEQAEQDHKVAKIVQKGYKIKEKVLRPARVIVGGN